MTGVGGTVIQKYNQVDAPTVYAWSLADGHAWLALDENKEASFIATAIAGLSLGNDAGAIPRARVASGLAFGDIRVPIERDRVMFYGPDDGSPWSATFIYAGPFSSDDEVDFHGATIVTRGTALGVDVAVDGPSADSSNLRAIADSVAKSLAIA